MFLPLSNWRSKVKFSIALTPHTHMAVFVPFQVAYNIQLLSSFLLCDILITAANHIGLLEGAETGGCQACYPGKVPDEKSKISRTGSKMPCACFLAAVNRNQLVYFLLANVLTGLVNFCVQTIFCTHLKGVLIVSTYLLLLNLLISVLHLQEKTLKF